MPDGALPLPPSAYALDRARRQRWMADDAPGDGDEGAVWDVE